MATLEQLVLRKAIVRIDPSLSWREYEARRLFCSPSFEEWCKTGLRTLSSAGGGGLMTPVEQLVGAVRHYCIGGDMDGDRRFKKLRSTPEQFVWEIKTPELRAFGWVPSVDNLIVVCGDSADRIKNNKLYGKLIQEVIDFRATLDLDEPKFVPSKDVRDVVSN